MDGRAFELLSDAEVAALPKRELLEYVLALTSFITDLEDHLAYVIAHARKDQDG